MLIFQLQFKLFNKQPISGAKCLFCLGGSLAKAEPMLVLFIREVSNRLNK